MRLLPPLSLEIAANREIIRWVPVSAQRGQGHALSAWLIERSVSKDAAQLLQ
jgi:hypothetical protein